MTNRRLRIGVDAKWLDSGPISGGVVLRGILKGLEQADSGHEIFVFRQKRALGGAPHHPFREVGTPNRLPNQISNLLFVPRSADRLHLDAVLYQSYAPTRARHARVCLVPDVIDLDHPEYFTRLERAYLRPRRWLIPRSDRVVTISDSERSRMGRLGVLPAGQGCDVVHLGVDESFRPRSSFDGSLLQEVKGRYALPTDFLLYVGRLNERKNLQRLIQAALGSECITPECPLVLVGAPDGKWSAPGGTSEAVKAGRVRFVGSVPPADLPIVFALAGAFAFLSLDEGFGMPPLEAMASGTPVLAARSGSLPEVCGDAAAFVDGTNVEEISRGIDSIMSDQQRRSELTRRGLGRARHFTWKSTAEALIGLLEDEVGGRAGR